MTCLSKRMPDTGFRRSEAIPALALGIQKAPFRAVERYCSGGRADVDMQRRELRLPETRAGRTHYILLSPPAVALLDAISGNEDNPHVFPGRNEGAHLVNIDKPWRRVRKAAGVEDVRLHDLRRTVGSWLPQAGNSLHLIGRVLNHSNASTTQVYARFGEDHVRAALEQHGERLLSVAGTQPMGVGDDPEQPSEAR